MANEHLITAKMAKNDEFYTRYEDIEREMNAYIDWNPDVFRDKTVLLPCDDPDWSGFTQYFAKNFDRLGLKKLISTCYVEGLGGKTVADIERNSPLFNIGKSRSRGKLLVMDRDAEGKSKGIEFRGYLQGNGDFKSKEVTKLRDEADVVITNPPFSKFREFMAWIQEGQKQFIVLGNKNSVSYKEIFPQLKENKMWLGARPMGQDAYFILPEDYKAWVVANREEGSAYKMVDGEPMGRAGVCWFTNIDHFRHHQKPVYHTMQENLQDGSKLRKKLEQDYGVAKYLKYDNYDAIEVPTVDAIPSDYAGVMGVPVTYLDRHNSEQFEILGITDRNNPYGLTTKIYTPIDGKNYADCNRRGAIRLPNGEIKSTYARLLIRNLHPEPCTVPLADVVHDPAANAPVSVSSGPIEVTLATLMAHAGMPSTPEPKPDGEDEGFFPCP